MTQTNDGGRMTHQPSERTPEQEAELREQQQRRNLPVAKEHMPLVDDAGRAIARVGTTAADYYAAVLEAGAALIKLKDAVAHGGFLAALEYLGYKERTAELWMRLTRANLKSATIADLGGIAAADKHLREQEAARRAQEAAAAADKERREREAEHARQRAAAEAAAARLAEEAEHARREAERTRKAAERARNRAQETAAAAAGDKSQQEVANRAAREAQAKKDDAARARQTATEQKAAAEARVAAFDEADTEAAAAERVAHRAAERLVGMEANVASEIARLQDLIRSARTTQGIVDREAEQARAVATAGKTEEARTGYKRAQAAADSLAEQEATIYPDRAKMQTMEAALESRQERIAILSADTPADMLAKVEDAAREREAVEQRNRQLQGDVEERDRTIFGLRKALAEAKA